MLLGMSQGHPVTHVEWHNATQIDDCLRVRSRDCLRRTHRGDRAYMSPNYARARISTRLLLPSAV